MSFLKDFKEDLTLAVSELLPQEEKDNEDAFQLEDTPEKGEKEVRSAAEEPQEKKPEEPKGKDKNRLKNNGRKNQKADVKGTEPKVTQNEGKKSQQSKEEIKEVKEETIAEEVAAKALQPEEKKPEEKTSEELFSKEPVPEKKRTEEAFGQLLSEERKPDVMEKEEKNIEIVEAEKTMDEMMTGTLEKETEDFSMNMMDVIPEMETDVPVMDTKPEPKKSSEVATITAGTKINGDIESDGSLEILGTITGNVTCNGKLTITGTIIGNSNADEIYADSAKIEGEINSAGAVKIGLGSVILGNVNATSAVVAGAIRGDIDVHGPVIVDTSAVVMGNIKSRSVQINNGAVIEGFCSQCYSDVSVKNFFEENKPSDQKK